MKDAKIYDGAGWQSLKGPPGPSAVSADAGNTVKLGSDSLISCLALLHTTDSYIVVQPGESVNAKYAAAALLTPRGQPKSATNRATLFIVPGQYALAGQLAVNTDFVDVVGLGGSPFAPAVTFTTATINVTANDVLVSGISVGTQRFTIAADKPLARFFNCRGGVGSFGLQIKVSGTFDYCECTSTLGFGGGGEASGVFRDCRGGDNCFGSFVGGIPGRATGTFIRCTGGISSFGGQAGADGRFEYCRSGRQSFGNGLNPAAPFLLSCVSTGDFSFQSQLTESRFFNCCVEGAAGVIPTFSPAWDIRPEDRQGIYVNCVSCDGDIYSKKAGDP